MLVRTSLFPSGLYTAGFDCCPCEQDFHWLGGYRLVRSMSATLAREIFEAPESAGFKAWLERMCAAYPMPEVWERDAKE